MTNERYDTDDSTATPSDRGLRADPTSGAERGLSTERRLVTITEKTTEGVPEAKVYCRQCKGGLGSEEELYTHWLVAHPDELYQINHYLREVEARLKTWEREVDEAAGKRLEKQARLGTSRKVL